MLVYSLYTPITKPFSQCLKVRRSGTFFSKINGIPATALASGGWAKLSLVSPVVQKLTPRTKWAHSSEVGEFSSTLEFSIGSIARQINGSNRCRNHRQRSRTAAGTRSSLTVGSPPSIGALTCGGGY